MSNLLLGARAVLNEAGYRTISVNAGRSSLHFEDASVLGVLCLTDSVEELLTKWEELQDQFLRASAPKLLADPLKAWNCYTVILTAESAEASDASALYRIEENFRGSRKIVRAGITTRSEIDVALGSLLPLRRVLPLAAEDVKKRLADRLGGSETPLRGILSDISANKIASALIGAS